MKNVIYVGYPSFPKGMAQVQRQLLIAKGLAENNCKVLVLNRYGVHNKTETEIKADGVFEGIDYKYCSGTPFRSESFLRRNILKIKGLFVELKTLIKESRKNNAKVLIITCNNFKGILYYTLVAKVLKYTSVVDQVEFWSAQDFGKKRKIDSFLNDRYYGALSDKSIVISDFLMTKLKKDQPETPAIKIPAICDFSKFQNQQRHVNGSQYFLYCGSAAYFEVIKFVLDSYALLQSNTALVLVISGDPKWIERVRNYIKSNTIQLVRIKSNIPYSELVSLYKGSVALLIPLRPNLQDIARFPHKLGEYTASKRPIVSSNIGEVKAYFKDGINAFLSETYNIEEYSKKMQEVIEFPEKREQIATRSFATGMKDFDYRKNSKQLYQFIFEN
ncbi:glycosyltransferase [uncultured Draconibacterium sp.]|uniref:glycosyltransferase n=1 Tax=uncultured Draconibacterium sp. TaxID=1573823 RepID=UPI0029C63BDD|nr:glycosyltransferase [uncultured Draconibacterium sp.]